MKRPEFRLRTSARYVRKAIIAWPSTLTDLGAGSANLVIASKQPMAQWLSMDEAIKQLVWERPQAERFDINGYREEGTTTTPFDMQVRNRTSRYHVVIQAAQKMAALKPGVAARAEELIRLYESKLRQHYEYIRREGIDPAEITNWEWRSD